MKSIRKLFTVRRRPALLPQEPQPEASSPTLQVHFVNIAPAQGEHATQAAGTLSRCVNILPSRRGPPAPPADTAELDVTYLHLPDPIIQLPPTVDPVSDSDSEVDIGCLQVPSSTPHDDDDPHALHYRALPNVAHSDTLTFPHSQLLLESALKATLDDPGRFILAHMTMVFQQTCDRLFLQKVRHSSKEEKDELEYARQETEIDRFLNMPGGIPTCITSAIEQPASGAVIWGMTNRKKDREAEVGFLIPALNGAMCQAYEDTFVPHATTNDVKRRAQLGSLITLTWLHELNHSFSRWQLQYVVNPTTFVTADLGLEIKGESGWQWEYSVFGGIIQVRWDAQDAEKDERFSLIQDLWIQEARSAPDDGLFSVIAMPRLQQFHDAVLNKTLTKTVAELLMSDVSLPSSGLPKTKVTEDNRVLLRGTSVLPHNAGRFSSPPAIFAIPHCSLALERMEGLDAKQYEEYWRRNTELPRKKPLRWFSVSWRSGGTRDSQRGDKVASEESRVSER